MRKETPLDYLDAARSFAETFFPRCDFAILAGSFVRNEQTSTSDLDIVIIDDSLTAPYRESFLHSGFPVEAFVHSQLTCVQWMRKDIARRRPSMPQMILEGVLLKGDDAVFMDMQALAAELLAAGPLPLSASEDADGRYRITDMLDDLIGSDRFEEQIFIASELVSVVVSYEVAKSGRWNVLGKRIPEVYRRLNGDSYAELLAALDSLHAHRNKTPVVAWAEKILDKSGGRLFAGYSQGKPQSD